MPKRTAVCLLVVFALTLGAAGWALATEEAAAEGLPPNVKVAIALAAGFGIAIAAFGGAWSQSRGIVAALEGIARNPAAAPKITTPMIVGLALIESLVISLIGGSLGIALGTGASTLVGKLVADLTPVVEIGSVLMAFSFAAAVGLIFGIYPAWRAARLRPIEALRYE